jgi:hypothetical protein
MTNTFYMTLTRMATIAVAGTMSAIAGESVVLKANVEFPFQANGARLSAGQYEVMKENYTGHSQFSLRGADGSKVVMLGYPVRKATGPFQPSMTFRCVADSCGLSTVSMRDGVTYSVSQPRISKAEKERMVTVYMNRPNAD